MPRHKNTEIGAKSKESPEKDAKFSGYININLNAEQKEDFEHVTSSVSLIPALRTMVIGEGYNLSVKKDRKSGGFRASLFDNNPQSPTAGRILSARAKDAVTAEERVLYLHHYVLGDDWSDFVEDGGEDDDW